MRAEMTGESANAHTHNTADTPAREESGQQDADREATRREKARAHRQQLIREHRSEAASQTYETAREKVIDGNAFLKKESTVSTAVSTFSDEPLPGWQLPQIGGEDWQENPDPVDESDPLEKAQKRLHSSSRSFHSHSASEFHRTVSAQAEQCVRADQRAQGRKVAEFENAISASGEDLPPFEAYVHVPYCYRRCGYCDFNTYVMQDFGEGASQRNYAATVVKELRRLKLWQEVTGQPSRPASTVYFGGGTPTLLPARDLIGILEQIRTLWGFASSVEITTEANPDTVSAHSIAQLANAGFTRISLGMQSAVPHVLTTLDRTHRQKNVVNAVKWAKQAGLDTSVDLIYGTPGESIHDWVTSVQAAISLNTDHVSCYALTLAPETRMGRQVRAGQIAPPNDDDEAEKYRIADRLLSQAGFTWYEISNWSKPGKEDHHNLGYWRGANWAGVGPGAHAHFGRLRTWDTRHPLVWTRQITREILPWAGSEWVDDQENVKETIMLGLRLREGLSLARIEKAAGRSVSTSVLEDLEKNDLIELFTDQRGEERIRPTLRGRLLNDAVISAIYDDVSA